MLADSNPAAAWDTEHGSSLPCSSSAELAHGGKDRECSRKGKVAWWKGGVKLGAVELDAMGEGRQGVQGQ